MLTPSKIIKYEYGRMGFSSFFVYGYQGVGKTTYALKVLKEVYGSWDLALKHLYFRLEPLMTDLSRYFAEGKRIPAVVVDDAFIALPKYRWMQDAELWFFEFFNLARTTVAGIIFTSIESVDIAKFVRDKIRYRIHVIRFGDKAVARGYEVVMYPSLEKGVRLVFEDRFSLSLPVDVREKYDTHRRAIMGNVMKKNSINVLQLAKKYREEGLSWAKIAERIAQETGVVHSKEWYRQKLAQK